MQADPLQQLRDIALPAAPSWWPPAPGWWLLLALGIGLLGWLIHLLRKRHQQRAPQRYATQLYAQLQQRYANQELTSGQYVHGTNQILKRLLIHQAWHKDAIAATDTKWLQLLDQLDNSQDFSTGPGQVLGNARFASTMQLDNQAFDALIRRFLQVKRS